MFWAFNHDVNDGNVPLGTFFPPPIWKTQPCATAMFTLVITILLRKQSSPLYTASCQNATFHMFVARQKNKVKYEKKAWLAVVTNRHKYLLDSSHLMTS